MTTKKPVLLIDQDDVLAEYIKGVTEQFNKKFGTNHTADACTTWDLVPVFGKEVLEVMHEPSLFETLEPVKDAIETFERLYTSNLFEMYIVTAAKPASVLGKHKWLQKYMPFFPESRMIVCSHKYMVKGDYLFDDGMHNIKAFEEAGGRAIVFDRPHNQENIDSTERVQGWIAFEQYIMDVCYPHLVESYFQTEETKLINA